MSTMFIRPLRGHQSRHLGRWIKADEEPYEAPEGEARRLVRHGVCEEVSVGMDPATPGGDKTAFWSQYNEEDES